MRDEHRDAIEDLAAAGTQVTLGYIPGAGPVLAALFGQAAGSAAQRRTKRILSELAEDVRRLRDQRGLPTEDVVQSDEFLAATERTMRRLIEAESEEKRKLLRNALLNMSAGDPVDREFERWLDRFDPDDVRVAAAVEDLTEGTSRMLEEVELQVRFWFEDRDELPPARIRGRVGALARAGILDRLSDRVVHNVPLSPSGGDGATGGRVLTTDFYDVSHRGHAFLAYLRDPLG